MNFDPRITPARPDLAAKHLEGKVAAARFIAGEEREVIDAQAPVRAQPSPDAPLMTEALMGERVTIYEFNDEGWAWGQLADDGYVGWLPANALLAPRAAPTHRVTALRTLAFPAPSIKLPPVVMPPLGAKLAVTREQDRFAVSPLGLCRRAILRRSIIARRISSRWRNASSAHHICGAARPIMGSIVRDWCRSR